MPRLPLRPLLIPALLVVACREEPLEPDITHGITTTALEAASGGWTVEPSMPTARFLHAAGVANNADGRPTLYVFGGTDGEVDGFSRVEAYDPETHTWTTQPFSSSIIGKVTTFNGIGRIGNKLYLPGGSAETGDGNVCTRTLAVYDPLHNSWARKADMPRNSCGGVAGVIDGKLYVLTSVETIDEDCPDCVPNTRRIRRLFRYDPATDRWVTLASCPNFHNLAMAGVIQGKFYVAGGGSDKLDIYDPGTNLWSSGAPLPSPRAGGGAAVLGAKLYVIGGLNGEQFTGEVLAYNPVTNRWITKAPLPTPRHFLAADRIVVGGQPRVVAVGGRLDLGATNETDLYAP